MFQPSQVAYAILSPLVHVKKTAFASIGQPTYAGPSSSGSVVSEVEPQWEQHGGLEEPFQGWKFSTGSRGVVWNIGGLTMV